MPSRNVYDFLINKGIRIDQWPYNRFDSLECEGDLISLFDVLSSVKDGYGNNVVFTMNTIMANPDFDKIRESNFQEYFLELFPKTYQKYNSSAHSLQLIMEGIEKKLLSPQFHGREHINVPRWMNALKNNLGNVRLAFEFGMFDLKTGSSSTIDSFMGGLNYSDNSELDLQRRTISEGTKYFESIFGFRADSFIAPSFIWSKQLHITLKNCGIHSIQGNFIQLDPTGSLYKYHKRMHYTGQVNEYFQIFLVRNVSFEPAENRSVDWIDETMRQIAISFHFKKPAIISSHRMNYIGSIDPDNRSRNLILLKGLLKEIIKKWPEAEFLTTSQLGDIIIESKGIGH